MLWKDRKSISVAKQHFGAAPRQWARQDLLPFFFFYGFACLWSGFMEKTAGCEMTIAKARTILFSVVASIYAVAFLLGWWIGIAIDYSSIAMLLIVCAPPIVMAVPYTIFRRMEPMRVALEAIFCGVILTVPIGLLTYVAMRLNFPLADEALVRMDMALGFDWQAFISFIDARPILAAALGYSYQSFSFQLLFIPILLVMFGKPVRAYSMIAAFGLLCVVASAISVWYPALGTYVVYDVPADSLVNINAHFGFAFLSEFHAVRNAPDFVFSLSNMQGILTFPSVHASVAVLCAWAVWGIRSLRYPFLALNVLMAVSAVSHANHYLVDVIAGIGVAGATIAVIAALFQPETSIKEKRRYMAPAT
jgi:membrane-associated phospholipid phosphatase